jgi:hypothetical protein
MRRFTIITVVLCAGALGLAQPSSSAAPNVISTLKSFGQPGFIPGTPVRDDAQPKANENKKFARGAKPTPAAKLLAAKRFVRLPGAAAPTPVAYVPKNLSPTGWLNAAGVADCVTAEEAFNQDTVGVFIQDQTVRAWAAQFGFLDGAFLPDVMTQLAKVGFSQDENTYSIGPFTAVDYSDEPTLQAAIALATVKIGIGGDALPDTAGKKQGWYAYGDSAGQFLRLDHCVGLCGFGPPQKMFAAVNASMPGDWPPASKTAYLLYTWGTIGVVDHTWIMSCCVEAWSRSPTATKNGTAQQRPPSVLTDVPPPPPGLPITVTVGGVSVGLDFTNKYATLPADWNSNVGPAVSSDLVKKLSDAIAVDIGSGPKDPAQAMAKAYLAVADRVRNGGGLQSPSDVYGELSFLLKFAGVSTDSLAKVRDVITKQMSGVRCCNQSDTSAFSATERATCANWLGTIGASLQAAAK